MRRVTGFCMAGDPVGLEALIIQSKFTPPGNLASSPLLPPLRRESIDQRQPIQTLPESAREIIDPALAAQTAPLPDLLHRHAQNQNLMHQCGAVGAEFALGAVQPQNALALPSRNPPPPLPPSPIF